MDKRSATWLVALVGLAVVLGLVFFSGGTRTKARRFDQEPTVNLVVDRDTGERKTMPMEEYIKGVVAGEMGQLPAEGGEKGDWPHEAYRAQAILARSFALNFLNDEGVVDISTDITEAQAYAPENITKAISDAVDATRGEVMTYNGKYVKAWFHSYSGGQTATAQEGLNYQEEPGFIKAVKLPENKYVPEDHVRWEARIPLAELSASLSETGVNVGDITDVRILDKGPSGRVTQVEVRGSGGTHAMHGADFRLAADPMILKSMLVDRLEVQGDNLVASGTGFGHGVGLSQWDAYMFAEEGQKAEQILKTFFQGIDIETVWD